MPEVAKAVVLPDLFFEVSREKILTLLLVWDSLEIACDAEDVALWDPWLPELEAAGVAGVSITPKKRDTRSDEELRRDFAALFKTRGDAKDPASRLVSNIADEVRAVLFRANSRGLASIALGRFSASALLWPPEIRGTARCEVSLIQAATTGVAVLPDTKTEDVLRFREKHAPLMGRFRASMTDLAHCIRPDTTTESAMEEAYAVIRNRIEPTLADLETVLKRGRIRHAWSMLLGASGMALGPVGAVAATTGGGRMAAQTFDYVFDRQRLVRNHPFGLIHLVRGQFGAASQSNRVVMDGRALGDALRRKQRYVAIEAPLHSADTE